jgi:hypothetical protein
VLTFNLEKSITYSNKAKQFFIKEIEMIGTIVRNFNESYRRYFSPVRKEFDFPISVSIEPDRLTASLRRKSSGTFLGFDELPCIAGETKNLSEDGIAFVVSFIRIAEGYLVGDGRTLNIELSLPNGKVKFQAVAQRYEHYNIHSSAPQFLIGARITSMSERDREKYTSYITDKHVARSLPKDSTVDLVLNLPR